MDAATIALIITSVAKIIKTAVDLGPDVMKTVEDAKPMAILLFKTLRGNEVTAEELATLEGQVDSLYAKLQEPLPPE